jgi:transmembrane sensor
MRLGEGRDEAEPTSPDEAAARWRVRHDRGNPNASERSAFRAWLSASPDHVAAWTRAESVWALFDDVADPHLDAMRGTALSAVPQRPNWLRLAAGIVLLAAPAAALIAVQQSQSPEPDAAASVQASVTPGASFATRRGERLGITLQDGTAVTLNTDTAIELAFERTRRTVRLLRGQALFDVAKDVHRPFVVQAAGREVVALGTVFDVRMDSSGFKVALVEGHVAVTDRRSARLVVNAPTVLRAGQAFTARGGEAGSVASVDTQAALLWRDGLIELDDVTLAEAARELNRYSPRQIVVSDPQLASLRVSGVFRTGAPERFVRVIAEVFAVAAMPTARGIEIVRPATAGRPARAVKNISDN